MAKNLPEIIKANPGCVAVVDNDAWHLFKASPNTAPQGAEEYEAWIKDNELASDADDFDPPLGDGGYGSGNCYGGDLLQALAVLVGMTVESV
jgi:hypothetical protein